MGLVGRGGIGGGVVGIAAGAGAAAAGAGAAGTAGASGGGAGTAAFGAAAPPPPSWSLNRSDPASTLSPSGMRSSRMTPAAGEGTVIDVLSVSISATVCSQRKKTRQLKGF